MLATGCVPRVGQAPACAVTGSNITSSTPHQWRQQLNHEQRRRRLQAQRVHQRSAPPEIRHRVVPAWQTGKPGDEGLGGRRQAGATVGGGWDQPQGGNVRLYWSGKRSVGVDEGLQQLCLDIENARLACMPPHRASMSRV